MNRRGFVKVAGGATVAALGGAGVLFARKTRMVALPAEPLQYFSPKEFSIFTAVAEAVLVLPPGQPTIEQVPVALNADRVMARYPADARADIHKLLALFDNALAGFLLTGTTAPFTQLSLPEREAFMRKWMNHRLGVLRSGFTALKRLAVACYYGDPSTYAGVGYPGPPEKDL